MKNNLHKNTKIELIDEILKLREKVENLEKENGKKDSKIKDLEGKLNINSSNSSKPSSTETLQKKTQICNSRIKGQNPRGGVKGHIGANHKQYENPDFLEILEVKHCEKCDFNLEKVSTFNETKRQVLDIPKPVFTITEYRSLEKTCPCCNHLNKPNFPVGVEQEFQFGTNIKASSVYMYNYQTTSYGRLEEFWKEIYGIKISQETLMNFNEKSFKNLEDFENKLKNALIKSPILNSDETGVRVNGKTSRIHTAGNNDLTYYYSHAKRGIEAINEMKVLEFFKGILVSDHWVSYKTFAHFVLHCFCNAHHLRELKWVIENDGKSWAENIIKLLLKSKKLKEEAQEKGLTFLEKEVLDEIHIEFKSILQTGKSEYDEIVKNPGKRGKVKKSKGLNLLLRLEKSEDGTLGFARNFLIPFDNNIAERDLRPIKTRTKISGCFRSFDGAKYFCRIRSYISTMRKQKLDIYSSIHSIFSQELLLPQF